MPCTGRLGICSPRHHGQQQGPPESVCWVMAGEGRAKQPCSLGGKTGGATKAFSSEVSVLPTELWAGEGAAC